MISSLATEFNQYTFSNQHALDKLSGDRPWSRADTNFSHHVNSTSSNYCLNLAALVKIVNQYTFSNLEAKMGSLAIEVDAAGRKRSLDPCLEPCAIERGMRVLGGKWKGSILWHLKDRPMRFNDLARQIGGASKKMVSQRLQEMEEMGLVGRKVIETKPIAVTYEITDFGRTALTFLEELKQWVEENNL